jgi:hypothetical protein
MKIILIAPTSLVLQNQKAVRALSCVACRTKFFAFRTKNDYVADFPSNKPD